MTRTRVVEVAVRGRLEYTPERLDSPSVNSDLEVQPREILDFHSPESFH